MQQLDGRREAKRTAQVNLCVFFILPLLLPHLRAEPLIVLALLGIQLLVRLACVENPELRQPTLELDLRMVVLLDLHLWRC